MHLSGVPKGDIAEKLGVHPATISAWFKREDVRMRVDALRMACDQVLVEDIRMARGGLLQDALQLLQAGMEQALKDGQSQASIHELTALVREVVSLYKLLAAQTGVSELQKVEVHTDALVEQGEKLLGKLLTEG